MRENIEVWVVHRADNPSGLVFGGKIELRVNRADHHIQFFKNIVRQVERTVFENVHFTRFQESNALELFIQLVNAPHLLPQPFCIEPANHRDALRMLRDGEIFVSALARCFGHFLDAVATVGVCGVAVQIAADVFEPYKPRQTAFARGINFAATLAQFRLDVWQRDLRVNFLLGSPADLLFAFENAVFVHLETALHALL